MDDIFTLSTYMPLGSTQPYQGDGQLTTISIDPQVTSLTISDTYPGGFNALECGLENPDMDSRGFLPKQIEYRRFCHVVLKAHEKTIYEGRMLHRSRPGGEVRTFGAQGYGIFGLNDAVYITTDTNPTDYVSSGTILREVLAQFAPLVRPVAGVDQFVDSSVKHARIEFQGKSPAEIVNQLMNEGGGGSTAASLFDFSVWENQQAYFRPRIVPAQPQYHVPWDNSVVYDEDDTDSYGSVMVSYTTQPSITVASTPSTVSVPPQTNAIYGPISDLSFQNSTGIGRTKLVAGGSNLSIAGAKQYAQTWLREHVRPKISCVITRQGGRGLELPGGQEVPPWLPRSGQWVQIGEPQELGGEPPLMIVQKAYNATTNVAQYTLQSYPFELDSYYNALRVATHVTRGTNPNTGA